MLAETTLALALLAAALPGGSDLPECFRLAEGLVKKIEALAMHKRGRAIEFAIRRDPKILCDVVERDFFSSIPEAPVGCDRMRPSTCVFPKGLQVAETLADDVGIVVFLRAQVIATRLRERGLLSPAHERLLSTLLLSIAESAHDRH